MEIQVRQAKKEDAQQMLNLYVAFTHEFVGLASRDMKSFQRMLRRRERINWIAINTQGKTVGYVSCRYNERRREGRIEEIVVHPNHDFEEVAKQLLVQAYESLMEKHPAAVIAHSIRNPQYERIFPTLGFLMFETTDVFMYTILDAQRFLNELAPVLVSRLKKIRGWNGLTQIECEGSILILSKTKECVEPIVWTNQPVDFKVILDREALIKLVFSVVDPLESLKSGKLKVEATVSQEKRNQLLRALFPKKQFLIMDHW